MTSNRRALVRHQPRINHRGEAPALQNAHFRPERHSLNGAFKFEFSVAMSNRNVITHFTALEFAREGCAVQCRLQFINKIKWNVSICLFCPNLFDAIDSCCRAPNSTNRKNDCRIVCVKGWTAPAARACSKWKSTSRVEFLLKSN